MFGLQSHFIFPTHAVASAGPLPRGAEKLEVKTGDGDRLAGIHIPADEPSARRTLLLAFGGNAWNAQDVAEYLHELFPETEVVAFHYRGYKPSSGHPSAEALIDDSPLVYDFAVERIRPERTVAVGFSIGSGVAAQLSAVRPVDGVILVTPFDSLKAVAQSMYPWLPIGPFFEHEIDAAAAAEKSNAPMAIIAAERDEIVPTARTKALKSRVPNLAFDRTIGRAGHNDIYARSEFQDAMREALAAVTR
jgi:pimeloyl-ACP methyl ester carboxylesterase